MKLSLEEAEAHLKTLFEKSESDAQEDLAAVKEAGMALLGHGLSILHVIADRLTVIASPPTEISSES